MILRKLVVAVVGMSALLGGGPSAAAAQEMTERYIPVGRSPGLSGSYTVIGKIQAINARDQTIALVGATGPGSAKITARTKIWLDRSKLRLTNLTGTFADLRHGATVEVKYEGHQPGTSSGPAQWIKIQIPASP